VRRDLQVVGVCAAVAAAAVLARLPFLGSIGPDEGGYAYVASEWAHGGRLYHGVWVDRPQGLLLAYRGVLAIAHTPWAIRLGALLAGTAVALLLVLVGCVLDSRRSGYLAGTIYALVGIGPRIEGFTFNGELLAAVPATAAVAAAGLSLRRTRPQVWLALAGLLGGCAMLMKQTGIDGLAVAAGVAVLGGGAARVRRLAAVAGGAALPLGASALAGLLTGWHAYWSSLVSYRAGVAGTFDLGVREDHFRESVNAGLYDLALLAAAAAAGVWLARRTRAAGIGLGWLAAAFVGFNVGGLYWPHYYVQLVAPLCLLAALGLARLRRPALAWAAAAVVALPALVFFGQFVAARSGPQRDRLIKYALGFDNDRRLARYVRARTTTRDTVYALKSRADFYFLARRKAPTPYLWAFPLNSIPGALDALERTLVSPHRPRYVIVFQQRALRGSGRKLVAILRHDYRLVWRAPRTGTPVYERTGATASSSTRVVSSAAR
jgi:4-amino-4-deoxy-L-arabinose transferase-like glycosyltransferase